MKIQESYICPYVRHNEASVSLLLDGGEWSDSRSNRFNSEEIAPSRRGAGGWLCFRKKLDISEKRKFVALAGNRNTETRLVDRLTPRLGSKRVTVTSAPILCYLVPQLQRQYRRNIITYILRTITCDIYKIIVMNKMYIDWNVHPIRLSVKTACKCCSEK